MSRPPLAAKLATTVLIPVGGVVGSSFERGLFSFRPLPLHGLSGLVTLAAAA